MEANIGECGRGGDFPVFPTHKSSPCRVSSGIVLNNLLRKFRK